MTLNPTVQGLLEQMAEQGAIDVNAMSPQDFRETYVEMGRMLDAQDVPIGKVEDRKIKGPGGEIPIRIYTPVAAGSSPLAALVYYHGGGWVIGNVETHDPCCRILANESGCRVISVDYRLAPEHRFPAAVEDSYAALEWVADSANDIGVDPNRIAVGGDSAGGNLAAVVAQVAKSKGRPKIAYQLLIYPVTDTAMNTASYEENKEGYLLEAETMRWFIDHYAPEETMREDTRIAPLKAENLRGLPPAYVVTAGYDPLRDEGRAYAEKLEAAGVDVTHVEYGDMVHGFFTLTGVVEEARAHVVAAAAALKKALK